MISVFDNGVGISSEDSQKLYKLFGCLQSNKEMNTKGVGLGLVISRLISERFGGTAQMLSKVQVGSVFQSSFEVPPQNKVNKRYSSSGMDHKL